MKLIGAKARKLLPKTIREHPDWKIWGTCWTRPNKRNKMTTIVIAGERGGGKSYNLLSLGQLLDRDENDNPRFSLERMCFLPSQFKEELMKDYPAGTCVCLDDAGLALYNKESLTSMVVELGKTLQTVRRKNPILLLSLPFFSILEKHARMFSDIYVEIVGRSANQNLVKIQSLEKDYYGGKIYRYNIRTKWLKTIHPDCGLTLRHEINEPYRIEKPPYELWSKYEERKRTYLDEWDDQSLAKMRYLEAKNIPTPKKNLYHTLMEAIQREPKKFKGAKNKFDRAKILNVFDGEDNRPTCSIALSYELVKVLNKRGK